MTAALIAVAVALAGAVGGVIYFARDALVKSDELGELKASRATMRAQMVNTEAALDKAVGEIDETRTRLEGVIRDQKADLQLLDEQLSICGDDKTRGRAAVVAIRRMLSSELSDDDAKADPND